MKLADLSQKELLAKLDGPAQSTVSKWGKGHSTPPSVENIRKLAQALECTADFLLGLTEWRTPLPANYWVIDRDREKMLLEKKVPPGDWAWPIPENLEVVSSTDFTARRARALGKKPAKEIERE